MTVGIYVGICVLLLSSVQGQASPEYVAKLLKIFDQKVDLSKLVPPSPPTWWPQQSTLDRVKESGVLRCGVNLESHLFSRKSSQDGTYSGFEISFCKAIAAAVLGSSPNVQYVHADANTRFELLLGDKIDVLFAMTTQTLGRDVGMNLHFSPVIFYDDLGALVPESVIDVKQIRGPEHSYCVLAGSITQKITKASFKGTPVPFSDLKDLLVKIRDATCGAVVMDVSSLVSIKQPGWKVVSLDSARSPMAGVTRDFDVQWSQLVDWTITGIINAELYGINQRNVKTIDLEGLPASARHMLTSNRTLPVADDFMVDVINEVGNYNEIFSTSLGGYINRQETRNLLYSMVNDNGLVGLLDFKSW